MDGRRAGQRVVQQYNGAAGRTVVHWVVQRLCRLYPVPQAVRRCTVYYSGAVVRAVQWVLQWFSRSSKVQQVVQRWMVVVRGSR
jgi:hypothetical protein